VEHFATIRPQHISLRGQVGDAVKGAVLIIPEKKYPFKIIDAGTQSGQNIKIQLDEISNSTGTGYELKVENISRKSGRYYDTIILKTDSDVQPELSIRVYGYLRERKNK